MSMAKIGGSAASQEKAELVHLGRELERLQTLRMLRPLTEVEASEYAELCAREAVVLEAAGLPVWPPEPRRRVDPGCDDEASRTA
jgi:hypothetical protein